MGILGTILTVGGTLIGGAVGGPAGAKIGAGIGSAVGSAVSKNGATKDAVKAQVEGQRAAEARYREALAYTRGIQDPYLKMGGAGVNALTSRLGLPGPGPTPTGGSPSQGPAAGPDVSKQYRDYFDANPDLGADQSLMSHDPGDLTGDGQVDDADRGMWHYREYGQREGRQLPAASAPPPAPPTTAPPVNALTGAIATGNAGTFGNVASPTAPARYQAPPRYQPGPPPARYAARTPPAGYVPRPPPPAYVNNLRR